MSQVDVMLLGNSSSTTAPRQLLLRCPTTVRPVHMRCPTTVRPVHMRCPTTVRHVHMRCPNTTTMDGGRLYDSPIKS